MHSRLNLRPHPAFESLRGEIEQRLRAVGVLIDQSTFLDVFDYRMRETLQIAFTLAGAHEGTVWLVDREQTSLVPVFNTGTNPDEFLRRVGRQPLSAGIISGVFLRDQAHCENAVQASSVHDKQVDSAMGLITTAQIAVPLHFAGECRGVISCVQLTSPGSDAPAPTGFPLESLRAVEFGADVLGRLLDHALLNATLGLSAW